MSFSIQSISIYLSIQYRQVNFCRQASCRSSSAPVLFYPHPLYSDQPDNVVSPSFHNIIIIYSSFIILVRINCKTRINSRSPVYILTLTFPYLIIYIMMLIKTEQLVFRQENTMLSRKNSLINTFQRLINKSAYIIYKCIFMPLMWMEIKII